MTIVVTVLCIAVAVLGLLVAGLLRSHAVMLRRLHEIGFPDLDDLGAPRDGTLPLAPSDTGDTRRDEHDHDDTPRPNDAPTGRAAADLSGVTPHGDPVVLGVAGRRHDTSLLFLSSDCLTCQPFWEAVGDGRAAATSTPGRRLVVVTKGPEEELAGTIARRPADVPVVMSSQAWADYEVPGSPYAIHVDGPSGRVRGEGTSASWEQLLVLLDRGAAETADRFDARGRRRRGRTGRPARDSDDELRAVGILPGDPSLYPDDLPQEDPS